MLALCEAKINSSLERQCTLESVHGGLAKLHL